MCIRDRTLAGDLHVASVGLGNEQTMAQLRGQAAVIIAGQPQGMEAAAPSPQIPEALAPQVVLTLEQRFPAWQVVGAILLGAFVAVLVIVVVTRFGRKKPA